jgi:hypothetical protein
MAFLNMLQSEIYSSKTGLHGGRQHGLFSNLRFLTTGQTHSSVIHVSIIFQLQSLTQSLMTDENDRSTTMYEFPFASFNVDGFSKHEFYEERKV